jgi:hypothetical protein
MSSEIDFVLPWVDGTDPHWRKELNKYEISNPIMNSEDRFRDWGNLQYIFRGIEKFTPWVRKIHFITCGHLPKWMNLKHPKLNVVNHEKIIPKEYLPVFNIFPIETRIHLIDGLSDKFVYFNDDFFLLKDLDDKTFFREGLPVDFAISDIMHQGVISHIIQNNIDIVNKYHNRHIGSGKDKRSIITKNMSKWFSLMYGKDMIQNILLIYWNTFTGFKTHHHPQPFLKKTFQEIWTLESQRLEKVLCSRFRETTDLSQYLFRYWQLVKGDFFPENYRVEKKKRRYVEVRNLDDAKRVSNDIISNKIKQICINDGTSKGRFNKEGVSVKEFVEIKNMVNDALQNILPEKSKFEI